MSPPKLQNAREKNLILELKIISASDISHINVECKMDLYAVVSITGDNIKTKQGAKTPIDFCGGSNPTWNHTVKFSVNEDEAARSMNLKVKLFSYWLEDEDDLYLGEVNVSVQDLLATNPLINGNADKFKFVTYPVEYTERIKGTLSFSYRFKSVGDIYPSAPDYSLSLGQTGYLAPKPATSEHAFHANLDPASLGQPVNYWPQLQTPMTKLTLMIVIKSAKDIKTVGIIHNDMKVYASVMIREGNTRIKDTVDTPIVYCAYRNPRWDHQVEFLIDQNLVQEDRLTLFVRLIGVRPLLGDKNVGEVVVSIKDLLELNPPCPQLNNGDGDDNGMTLMTRDVRGLHGRKGTLSFTFKFLVEQASQPLHFMYSTHPGENSTPLPPQYHHWHGYRHDSSSQPHKPQPQLRPLNRPLLHMQSQPLQSHGNQQYSPGQQLDTQSQLLSYQQYSPVQPQQPPTQITKPQGGSIAMLGLGASIAGRVIGGALMGDIMSDEINMLSS